MIRRVGVALGLVLAMACGGGQTQRGLFSESWNDDNGKSIDAVRRRLDGVIIPRGADVAVGVAGHSTKLVGQPLAGGARWTFAHPIDSRPAIAGGVVVATGNGDLFALDALTGRRLWSRPVGGIKLRGAGDDGAVTVVTMTRPTGEGSTLLAIARDGGVLRQIEADVPLGVPAVVSHLAFIPWGHQYISVLDVSGGGETARLLLREKTTHAWTSGGALYFGELGMFRLDDKIKDASSGRADHLSLPAKTLPGQPLFMGPGEEILHAAAGAADKIRLYARPSAPDAPLALDSDRFYATYFRLALGLTGNQARLAWVHTHASALIGGAVGRGTLVLCDVDGGLTVLDARAGGEYAPPAGLGEPLESCVVQVDGFAPSGTPKDPLPLLEQMRRALSDRDLELASGQTLLRRELATAPDDHATELLLQIATDPLTTPLVRDEARTSLANRRSGPRYLIAALEKHYDFLHDVLIAPPVGPIARALAGMKAEGAAPLLAAHLLDPANADKDVRDVALALVTLAGSAEVPALKQFFALYRDAPPEPAEVVEAASSVGEALLRAGGKEGHAVVQAALDHAGTNPAVRAKLKALLDAENLQRDAPSTKPSSTSRE
jgi:outer membrane protein assembly factor BamB